MANYLTRIEPDDDILNSSYSDGLITAIVPEPRISFFRPKPLDLPGEAQRKEFAAKIERFRSLLCFWRHLW